MAESPKSGWQVSGNAPVAWQKYMIPACAEPFARNLVERVGLRRGQRVLDAGCGTGVVARMAVCEVRWHGKVTGLDLNSLMLDVARQASVFVHPEIEWVEGDMQKMPLPDASFDAVLCQWVLQYVPDRAAAVREMHRVLAPGGRLALSVFRGIEVNPGWVALQEALDVHVSQEAGDIFRSIFQMKDGEELRTLATGAGFHEVQVESHSEVCRYPGVAEFVRFELDSMPTPALWSHFEKAEGAIVRDVSRAMAHWTDDHGVAFPATIWVLDAVE
ncbi:MAG TPA: methyltransferase domain-containing protein [Kofleriaceae bacterium]|nr:methyltransferase domain-containing protein [Kofleriaceae bacterium]